MRVLLFEDDECIKKLVVRIIRKHGYEIHAFSSPSLCPLIADPHCDCPTEYACADVIISDRRMPQIDGMEFLRRLFLRDCKAQHLAMMSAALGKDEISWLNSKGVKIFSKPFAMQDMLSWLEACAETIAEDRQLIAPPEITAGDRDIQVTA